MCASVHRWEFLNMNLRIFFLTCDTLYNWFYEGYKYSSFFSWYFFVEICICKLVQCLRLMTFSCKFSLILFKHDFECLYFKKNFVLSLYINIYKKSKFSLLTYLCVLHPHCEMRTHLRAIKPAGGTGLALLGRFVPWFHTWYKLCWTESQRCNIVTNWTHRCHLRRRNNPTQPFPADRIS